MDIVKVDPLAFQKISKRHFLEDIEKSFQEVTPISPEPHHFFPFQNSSTNTVAREIVKTIKTCFFTDSMGVYTYQMMYNNRPSYRAKSGRRLYYLPNARSWLVGPSLGSPTGYLHNGNYR